MTHKYLAILAGILLCTASVSPSAAQQKLRIVQTNSAGDNIHIIDAVTNKVVGEIKGIEAPHGLTVSPDGSRIVTASQDKTALIWDAHTNVQLAVLSGHDGVVTSAAYSQDGSRIVTASQDKTLVDSRPLRTKAVGRFVATHGEI